MTLFELGFTLTAVILGLALTNIVASLHRLALAGKKVRWAPEPLLLAAIVVLIIVFVWLNQWSAREVTEITVARSLLQVAKMMALYFAAASCLPEPDQIPADGLDLYAYYDSSRALTFGALAVGLILFSLSNLTESSWVDWRHFVLGTFVYPAAYLLLIFVRRRWFDILFLTLILVLWGARALDVKLTQAVS